MKKASPSDLVPDFGIRGVGKQTAKLLAKLDIYSVQDLLLHLPFRYQDRTQIESIARLKINQEAVIEGVLAKVSKPLRGRTKLLCELVDKTGSIELRFFHVLSFQEKILKAGSRFRCYSTVRLGPKGLEMVHPEFQLIADGCSMPIDPYFTPIYPATEGLSQYVLRKLMMNALMWMQAAPMFCELLPSTLLQTLGFPTLKEALQFVHRPPRATPLTLLLDNNTVPQKRLVFEELLAHKMSLLKLKHDYHAHPGVPLIIQAALVQRFLAQLPFQLTQAQARVIDEIKRDLLRSQPMLRLVQGDVGSGKTVVAACAMLQAVENGYQAAMMAPTELLAEQHYHVFKRWLEPLGVNIVFLSGRVKSRERAVVTNAIQSGQAQIILGTHALFQEDIQFSSLALIVTDEQHRFGVQQRALFREKGVHLTHCPHQLIMTATPIPRTLAMSFYADLDCSVIDELPPGRTPVVTSVMANAKRDEVVAHVRGVCQQDRQVYWVCPLIDESEVITCQAATSIAQELQVALPELKIGLIHGRMKADSKDVAMRDFQKGETHVLVATTVIEVGVDVPNASVMIIENAERLGLSQLHQLRGRVGRGAVASYCILLYQVPLSMLAKKRLTVMRDTTDGFKIAECDLELRGPGELLGTRQTGALTFRIADLMRDSHILPQVQQASDVIMSTHQDIIPSLVSRWLGSKGNYGKI